MPTLVSTRVSLACVVTVFALAAAPASGATCADLTSLALPHAAIDSAQIVGAGAFAPSAPGGAVPPGAAMQAYRSLPAFCRVVLRSMPSSDSDIRIEVWLPESRWNGKFQGVGNGGWAGVIGYQALANGLLAGYATASTDGGHVGNTAAFAPGHPEKVIDMGYRAVHEMTIQGQAVTDAYYGRRPALSFFSGCSIGGRQAVTEAMRYPSDYDGIIAGAPALYTMEVHAARIALNAMAHRTPAATIPATKYAAIHEAVLNACDSIDGIRDGVIDDPRQCRFDPQTMQCKGADEAACLTAPQVETARAMYAPMKVGRAGTIPPLLQPGSELGWAALAGPEPFDMSMEPMKHIVFNDPQWNVSRFNPATDLDRTLDADKEHILSLTDPNLGPFFDRGGKLLIYHGWQDQQGPSLGSIRYFNDVVKALGPSVVGRSFQLYMIPGMNHCQGGPGTDTFDKMGAIESFVATGKAPASIPASHLTGGTVDRTRPLCPYGQVAKWQGTGSTDDGANFACVPQTSGQRAPD